MHDDPGRPSPLRPRIAWALTLWAVAVTLVHLAVRELGLPLVP